MQYTAEEACDLLVNDDNFGQMDSANSLDNRFSDFTTSCSEMDSDPENDYWKNCFCDYQTTKGHPRTRGLKIWGRVCVPGGSFRGRCLRTHGGHGKRLASEALDDQQQPQAPDGGNAGVALSDSDDNWTEEPTIIKNFSFTETSGMKIDVPADVDPVFFNLISTKTFVENLVKNTNEYTDKVINAFRLLQRRYTWNNWKIVDVDEMKKFIGIIFSMGIITLPAYKKYWSTNILYKNEHFPSAVSRERFKKIIRFFNFGKKPHFENDKLSDIWMILDHLSDVTRELVTSEKNLSIDESMIWHGRLVFWQ